MATKIFITIFTFAIGIAFNLFTAEIRCCLGIDPCELPPCVQIRCLLGIHAVNQCPKPPIQNQYEICKKRFDQSPCQGILTDNGKCYLGELRQQYNGQGFLLVLNGDECYDGQFQNGKFHGEGFLLYRDKTVYQGVDVDALDFLTHIQLKQEKTGYFRAIRDRYAINPARSYACGDEQADFIASQSTGTHPFMVSYGFEGYWRLVYKIGVPEELISRDPETLCKRVFNALDILN